MFIPAQPAQRRDDVCVYSWKNHGKAGHLSGDYIKGNTDNFTVNFRILAKGKAICIYASIRYYQLDKGSATGAGSC